MQGTCALTPPTIIDAHTNDLIDKTLFLQLFCIVPKQNKRLHPFSLALRNQPGKPKQLTTTDTFRRQTHTCMLCSGATTPHHVEEWCIALLPRASNVLERDVLRVGEVCYVGRSQSPERSAQRLECTGQQYIQRATATRNAVENMHLLGCFLKALAKTKHPRKCISSTRKKSVENHSWDKERRDFFPNCTEHTD